MIILIQKSNMNWERQLNTLSFLSLKSKDGESNQYVKLSEVKNVCENAYNEALDKVKEIYKDEKDIVDMIKDLKI
jgi:hypothetical protein